jgi:hypothetical protein
MAAVKGGSVGVSEKAWIHCLGIEELVPGSVQSVFA